MSSGVMRGKSAEVLAWALIMVFSAAFIWNLITFLGEGRSTSEGKKPSAFVALAREKELEGDIPGALSFYRKAIEEKPTLCDPRSMDYLGDDFESKIDAWIKELRRKNGEKARRALLDASFIFRKLHGGCG